MTDNYGMIWCEEKQDSLGRWSATYSWEGPPIARVRRVHVPTSEGVFELGSWLMRVVEVEPWSDTVIIELIDHPLGWAYALRHKARMLWGDFTYRMVYTLAIWGLAKQPEPGGLIDWKLVRDKWL